MPSLFYFLKKVIEIVSLLDINLAIINQVTERLKTSTYNNVEFSSTDITEEIIRPSFYIEFDENKTGRFNKHNKERTLDVKLYYFANSREDTKIELLEMQDLLENTFIDYLKVNEVFFIAIENIDFEINKENGFLICSFELYTLEEMADIEEQNADLMEELKIKGVKLDGTDIKIT